MSDNDKSHEVPVEVNRQKQVNRAEKITKKQKDSKIINESTTQSNKNLKNLLAKEIQKVKEYETKLKGNETKLEEYETKLKRTLADFQNLQRKTNFDIEKGINDKMDKFMLEFLNIYDDFIRAKRVFGENKINTEGLDSILKNMNSLLSKYNIMPIDAIGEIFDPRLHEAISIIEDYTLDEDTITKEIRKGYISGNRVIRPTLVEISKKSKSKLGE